MSLTFSDLKGGVIPSFLTVLTNWLLQTNIEQGILLCWAVIAYTIGVFAKHISQRVLSDQTAPVTILCEKIATFFKNIGR